MTMREKIHEYAVVASSESGDVTYYWKNHVQPWLPRSKRIFLDEVAVLRGQKIRKRVGKLPASVPSNGRKDVKGQTVFTEAI